MSYCPPWLDQWDEDFAQSWGEWEAINGGDTVRDKYLGPVHERRRLARWDGMLSCIPCALYFGLGRRGEACPDCGAPLTESPARANVAHGHNQESNSHE